MDHRSANAALDLGKYRNLPVIFLVVGAVISLVGLFVNHRQFAFWWLLSFMFFLSLSLGALFLVMIHHLFDAGWSVPIRRFCEHIAALVFPWLALLFVPVACLASTLYSWMDMSAAKDHSLAAKQPLYTPTGFYLVAAFCFLVWWWLTNRLRYWSLQQDETGGAKPTYRMRFYSALGIFLFAFTMTIAAIMWMQGVQFQWFSTMYGVYYFAGSVWAALATAYVLTMLLDRQGVLAEVLQEHQYYYIGSLMLAFTVFYAYIHFAQYFIIWNGNMPEENFWYLVREKGSWWWIGMVIIFGHFFIPFLALLRIDVKSFFLYMAGLSAWTWLMHWVDLAFNVIPALSPNGFPWQWLWLAFGCWAFMGGLLLLVFMRNFSRSAPYPVKDPRLLEAMGLYHPLPTQISGGELEQDAPPHPQGGAQ